MSCNPCNDCPPSVSYTLPDCPAGESCEEVLTANCVVYKGPNLPNIGLSNNARLKDILIALNTLLAYNITAKTYTILVNFAQSPTTVEYIDMNGSLAMITVQKDTTTTICAMNGTPVVTKGNGYLVKGPITYTSAAGATASGTTITVASTTGMTVGDTIFLYTGAGAFAPNTTVTSIVSATQFTVSAAPVNTLANGALLKTYTTGSVDCPA